MATTLSQRRVCVLVTFLAAIAGPASAQTQAPAWHFESIAPGHLVPNCVTGGTLAGFEIDPQGRPALAWREENGCGGPPRVFWSRFESDAWQHREFIADRGNANGHQFALRETDGNPFMIFAGVGQFFETNTYRSDLIQPNQPSAFLENVVPPQNCDNARYSLAFGPADTIPQWTTGVATCNGQGPFRLNGSEIVPQVFSPHGSLAIAADGTRHVLWNSGTHVFYTRWPAAVAAPDHQLTLFTDLNRFGGELKIAIDNAGVLHAIVKGPDVTADWDLGAIVYLRSDDNGATWSTWEYVDPHDDPAIQAPWNANSDLSLALAPGGIPAITFWRWNSELWYAKRDGPGGTWTQQLITALPFGNAHRTNQLRFDGLGQPVVAFFDPAINRLRLARPIPAGASMPVDIAVTASAAPALALPGSTAAFTFTVTNRSAVNLDQIVLTNRLPRGVALIDASPAPSLDGTWTMALTAGASRTFTLNVQLPFAAGVLVDVVAVSIPVVDDHPADNSAAAAIDVKSEECLAPHQPDSGLTGWWRGEDSAVNSAPGVGPATAVDLTYGDAVIGRGFVFNGTSSGVHFSHSNDNFYYPANSSFTVQAFIKTPAQSGQIAARYECTPLGCTATAWFFGLNGNGRLNGFIRDRHGVSAELNGTRQVDDGAFHHVALVFDRSAATLSLFVDGQLDGSVPASIGEVSDSNFFSTPLVIGAFMNQWDLLDGFFTGVIDEVAIYSRALTAAELGAVAAAAADPACATPTPAPGMDVSVTGTATPTTVTPAGISDVNLAVRNNGPEAISDLTIELILNDGVVVDTAPAAVEYGNTVTLVEIATLAPGEVRWINARIMAPPAPGEFILHARHQKPGDTFHGNDHVVITFFAAAEACFVPATNLVARWRFDGDAADSAGTHAGQLRGDTSFDTGIRDRALRLGVAQSFVEVADAGALRPQTFTAAAWINPASTTDWDTVVAKGASGIDGNMAWFDDTYWLGLAASGYPTLYTYHGGGLTRETRSPDRLAPGQWYHLSATYDGSVARVYVDGVQVAESTINQPLYYDVNPVPLTIGEDWQGGSANGAPFVGLIDDVTVHDRALSPADIVAMITGSSSECVNHPPVAVDDAVELSLAGAAAHATVVANDSDPDGDPLTIVAIVSPPSHGTASFSAQSISYAPELLGYAGSDSLTYRISDGRGEFATATLTIMTPPAALADLRVTADGPVFMEDGYPRIIFTILNAGPATATNVWLSASAPFGNIFGGPDNLDPAAGEFCMPPDGQSLACQIAPLAAGAQRTMTMRAWLQTEFMPDFQIGFLAMADQIDPNPADNGMVIPVSITITHEENFVQHGTLTWEQDSTFGSATEARIRFSFSGTYTRSHFWYPGPPQIGEPLYLNVGLSIQGAGGYANWQQFTPVVTTVDIGRDTVSVTGFVDVVIPTSAMPVSVRHEMCCRRLHLQDGNTPTMFTLQTFVDPSIASRSPVSSSGSRIYGEAGRLLTVQLPASAVAGFTTRFRIATLTESQLATAQPAGLTVSAAGQLNWTPAAVGLYSLQHVIEAVDDTGTVRAVTPVEQTIEITPPCAANCPEVIAMVPSPTVPFSIGREASFDITATTVNAAAGYVVDIDSASLPPGASLTTVTSGATSSIRFRWTSALPPPRLPEHGPYAGEQVCFQATATSTVGHPTIVQQGQTCVDLTYVPTAVTALFGTIRDFTSAHPDFDSAVGDAGSPVVHEQLGADRKPVFAGGALTTIESAASFAEWFNDGPRSVATPHAIVLGNVGPDPDQFVFDSTAFRPYEHGTQWGDATEEHGRFLTFEGHGRIAYQPGNVLQFRAADDLWVFINGQRVINLSGVHAPLTSSVDLDARAGDLGLVAGDTFTVDIFYAHRGTHDAALMLALPPVSICSGASVSLRDPLQNPMTVPYNAIVTGTIDVFDACGARVAASVADVTATFVNDGSHFGVALTAEPDGSVSFSARPLPGPNQLLIAYGGVPIPGSPFSIVVDAAPKPVDDAATTPEDSSVTIDVLANDAGPAPLTLVIDGFIQPVHGTVVAGGPGQLVYTPAPNFHGADAFSYTVKNSLGWSATAWVSLTIASVNDAPIAVLALPSVTMLEDAAATTVSFAGVFSDPDGDALTYGVSGFGGVVTFLVNGEDLTIGPVADANGAVSIGITAFDPTGASATSAVAITVMPVNDPPTLAPLADVLATSLQDTTVALAGLTPGPANEAGQALTIEAITSDSTVTGALLIVGGQTILFMPPVRSFLGTAVVTIRITDDGGVANGGGNQVTRTFGVSVLASGPVNHPPVIDPVAAQTWLVNVPALLTLHATDTEGDPVTWQAEGLPPGWSLLGNGATATLDGSGVAPGIGVATIRAIDQRGATGEISFPWVVSRSGRDLRLTFAGPTSIAIGSVASYVLTVANIGTRTMPADAAQLTYAGSDAIVQGCPMETYLIFHTLTCSFRSLAPGESEPHILTITANHSGLLPLQMGLRWQNDDYPENDALIVNVGISGPSADIGIGLTAPATVRPYEAFSVTVVATNHGPEDSDPASSVDVSVPGKSPPTILGGEGCTVDLAANAARCEMAEFAAGESRSFQIWLRAGATTGLKSVVAAITQTNTDPVAANDRSVAAIAVAGTAMKSEADLVATIIAPDVASLDQGPVVAVIRIANRGPDLIERFGATISVDGEDFNYPTMSGVCSTATQTGMDPLYGSLYTWNVGPISCSGGPIPPGGFVDIELPIGTPGLGVYTVRVEATTGRITGGPQTDPNRGNDSDHHSIRFRRTEADFAIVSLSGPSEVEAGGEATYQVVARNNGPDAAPGQVSIWTGDGQLIDGSCRTTLGLVSSECNTGLLSPGMTFTATFRIRVNLNVTRLTVRATAHADALDTVPNNSMEKVTDVRLPADLDLELNAPWRMTPGVSSEFSIVIRNHSSRVAIGVFVEIRTTGLPFLSTPFGCIQTPGYVQCSIGSVGANSHQTLQFVATPTTTAVGIATVRARVSTHTFEVNTANNEDDHTFEVFTQRPSTRFAIQSVVTNSANGRDVTFTITNVGSVAATSVEVRVTPRAYDSRPGYSTLLFNEIPAGCTVAFAFDPFSGFGGWYQCDLGLAPGESRTVVIKATYVSTPVDGGVVPLDIHSATHMGVSMKLRGTTSARVELPAVQ